MLATKLSDGTATIVRNCRIADLCAILEIEKESFGADAYTRELFLDLLRSTAIFKVAITTNELGARVVGYIIYSEMKTLFFEIGRKTTTLISLAVDPKWRRKGIASMLLDFAISELSQKGYEFFELQVGVSNKEAISLYSKFRFEAESAVLQNYYGKGKNALIMRRELSKEKVRNR